MKWVMKTSLFFSVVGLGASFASGCSSDSEEPSGGGAGESASGGASASGGQSATGGSGAGGGDGGVGGAGGIGEPAGEPAAPNCPNSTPVIVGRNYGEYSVYAIRLASEVEPGDYSVRVHSGDSGKAYVYQGQEFVGQFDYQPETVMALGESETIAFPELFEVDLRSADQTDLSALDQSVFDGCHLFQVEEAGAFELGGIYGGFEITALTLDPTAPTGTYTFFAQTGNAGEVQLLRDGVVVDTLSYVWGTTIGNGGTYTFHFSGVVSFTVDRPMGTSNLFGLGDALFDARHELVVE